MRSSVPPSTTIVLFLYTVRYEWLADIVRFNEHLPGGVVDTEDSLMFLRALISLF